MQDILFDITTREIVLIGAGDNSDFETTGNPSIQNGGILLYSRGANIDLPMVGIGLIPDVINGPVSDFTFEMNRWRAQAIADQATLARWTPQKISSGAIASLTEISYL
jgi:hypothetical protein